MHPALARGPILWFLGKTLVFLFIYVWLRGALPRLRYDQLMDLGWKVLIPLSLGWVLVVAAVMVGHWWGVAVVVALAVGGGILLLRSVVVGAEREERRPVTLVARPDDERPGVGRGGGAADGIPRQPARRPAASSAASR